MPTLFQRTNPNYSEDKDIEQQLNHNRFVDTKAEIPFQRSEFSNMFNAQDI
jgi:hypothetical protein